MLRRSLVGGICVPIFVIAGAFLWAEDAFFLPDIVVAGGAKGIEVPFHCSNDAALSALSIAIQYRPQDIAISSFESLTAPTPGFWQGSILPDPGYLVWGCVFDMSPPLTNYLPPGIDQPVARIVVDLLAPVPFVTPLDFKDGLPVKPDDPLNTAFVSNYQVNSQGKRLSPVLRSGSISAVSTGSLQVDAGPDRTAAEGSTARLDGSRTTVPADGIYGIRWTQVSGPPAQALGSTGILNPPFLLPAVSGGDQPAVFELTISSPGGAVADRVTVTVIDLDLRKGALQQVPRAPAKIDSGRRAIAFEGDLRWGPAPEDGAWTGIRFQASGAGDESKLLASARLYLDANGDDAYDPGDRQLGEPQSLASDDGTISFAFSEPIQSGARRRFFLVLDVAPDAIRAGELIFPGLLLAAGIPAAARTIRRRGGRRPRRTAGRSAWAILLVLAVAAIPLSCGGGGGGGGGNSAAVQPWDREVRFGVVDPGDIQVQGASTGVAGSISGLPVLGSAFEI
jgi:hypothetical protein